MVDISDWEVDHVYFWVKNLPAFENVAKSFKSNCVDGQLLLELDDEMLVELGIDKKLHRRRFLLARDDAVKNGLQIRPKPKKKIVVDEDDEDIYMVVKPTTQRISSPRPASQPVQQRPQSSQSEDPIYMEVGQTAPTLTTPARSSTNDSDIYGELSYSELEKLFETAASNDINAYKKLMKHLHNMFPQVRREDIELAFTAAQGKVAETVDLCLAIQTSPEVAQQLGRRVSISSRPNQQNYRRAEDTNADFIHDNLSREDTEAILRWKGLINGMFLLRPSTSINGAYVLSVAANQKVYHHVINPIEPQGHEMLGMKFQSLTDLVHFCSDYHADDGWRCPLSQHVTPRDVHYFQTTIKKGNYAPLTNFSSSANELQQESTSDTPEFPSFSYGQERPRSNSRAKSFFKRTSKPGSKFDNPAFHDEIVSSPSAAPKPSQNFHFRPEDFDLETEDNSRPYSGDQQYEVSCEGAMLGMVSHGQMVLILMTTETVLYLIHQGKMVLSFSYNNIQEVEAANDQLQLVVDGRHSGLFKFTVHHMPAAVVAQTIRDDKDRFLQSEDRRLAQLLQNEEFVAQLAQQPEFRALASDQSSGTEKKKRKQALKNFVSRFSIKRNKSSSKSKKSVRSPRLPNRPISVEEFSPSRSQTAPGDMTSSSLSKSPQQTDPPQQRPRTSSFGTVLSRKPPNAPLPELPTQLNNDYGDVDINSEAMYASMDDFQSPRSGHPDTQQDSDDHHINPDHVRHKQRYNKLALEEALPPTIDDDDDDDYDDAEVVTVLGTVIATRNKESYYDDAALSFIKGDRILLLRIRDDGFGYGELKGNRGLFPLTLVEPADRETASLLNGYARLDHVQVTLDHDRGASPFHDDDDDHIIAPPGYNDPHIGDFHTLNIDEDELLQ